MADLFGRLKSGAGKVAFEADKLARQNHAQSELAGLKKQNEALYAKLGELAYRMYVKQEAESPDFAATCAQITELERQIVAKGEEIKRIIAETYSPQATPAPAAAAPVPTPATPTPSTQAAPAAAAQTKFCPNCGKEMAVTVKFCPDCGTKMP